MALLYCLGQGLQVDFSLAAAGDAVEQEHLWVGPVTAYGVPYCLEGRLLGGGKFQRGRRSNVPVGNRLASDFNLPESGQTLAGQCPGNGFVHPGLLPGFRPGHRSGLSCQEVEEGRLFHGSFFPQAVGGLTGLIGGNIKMQVGHFFGAYLDRFQLVASDRQSPPHQPGNDGPGFLLAQSLFQLLQAGFTLLAH